MLEKCKREKKGENSKHLSCMYFFQSTFPFQAQVSLFLSPLLLSCFHSSQFEILLCFKSVSQFTPSSLDMDPTRYLLCCVCSSPLSLLQDAGASTANFSPCPRAIPTRTCHLSSCSEHSSQNILFTGCIKSPSHHVSLFTVLRSTSPEQHHTSLPPQLISAM